VRGHPLVAAVLRNEAIAAAVPYALCVQEGMPNAIPPFISMFFVCFTPTNSLFLFGREFSHKRIDFAR
jgi:hypothetical protein